MSAPRVPPVWTQAAADLVWEDWQAALGAWSFEGPAGRFLEAWTRETLSDTEVELVARGFLAPVEPARWASPEARLRAWAAVGAPVLAPAEDGRPSLAEWVNVCEAAGLVYDPAHGADAHISFRNSDTLLGVWVHVWNAHDVTMEVDSRTPQAIATPDALRAALDALAVRA